MNSHYVKTKDFYIEKYNMRESMTDMHYHRTNELYYIVSGERDYFIEQQFFKAADGDFVMVPRDLMHKTAGKGATRILIYFSDSFLLKFFSAKTVEFVMSKYKASIFRPPMMMRGYLDSTVASLLHLYEEKMKNGDKNVDEVIASYLFAILFTIATADNYYIEHAYPDERISQIIKYINENYSQIDNIEEIASKFYISKFYLCKIFSENLNTSIVSYLNMVKIHSACQMIRDGNERMVDIALRCGFNSSSYFCKVFKKEMGITPREFIRQNKLNSI